MKAKVLVIVGPTASGKSALAVELARSYNGEVISADSRQMYRGLNIGTGKITKKEMSGVPHHLLDVASPKTTFTADAFVKCASAAIADISSRGKLPIVCGGTGFYIDALFGRIALPNVAPNNKLRGQLQTKTAAQLFAMLKQKDPRRAKSLSSPSERNNKVRLIRALEIAATLGKSPVKARSDLALTYDALWIGINLPQKELEKKIQIRLKSRLKKGMINEAKRLHAAGLSYKRMEALGLEYRSLARLLQNKITRKEFEEELFRDIRRYAKKQMGYWKRNHSIRWFPNNKARKLERLTNNWLSK